MYNNEVKVYNFYICSIMILFSALIFAWLVGLQQNSVANKAFIIECLQHVRNHVAISAMLEETNISNDWKW